MNRETLEKLAKNHEASIRVIAKDMEQLARMLKKTPFEDEDKFQANLVQSSFYMTAVTMAARAFNAMVNEKQANPNCDRKQVDYFMDEVIKMQAMEMDKEKEQKNENTDLPK